MKILIDIGHPGHVHLFKNFYWEMKKRGHEFVITTKEKECSIQLLEAYEIPYINLGKPKKGAINKVLGLAYFGRQIYNIGKREKADLFLSVSSMYAAHAAFILGKKHIVLDDTEHSTFEHLLYKPFSNLLVNPNSFEKDFGNKQIKYNGFHELAYLHPKYYQPNKDIFKVLDISENEPFSIVRFVGWNAGHDIKQKGMNVQQKTEIVEEIMKHNRVFITSEENLPDHLKPFQIKIEPHMMHDALAHANLYIGEGATMASECAMLGTPAIYINTLNAGTLKAQERLGLIHSFRDYNGVKESTVNILQDSEAKNKYLQRAKALIKDSTDVSQFLVDLTEDTVKPTQPILTIQNIKEYIQGCLVI